MGSLQSNSSLAPVPEAAELVYGLYPGVEFFSADYGSEDYAEWVEQSNGDPVPAPLAVYIQDGGEGHCEASAGKARILSRAPAAIGLELRLQGALFDCDRTVQQLVCSGRIATDWTDDQLYELVTELEHAFTTQQNGLANWCACIGHVLTPESRLRLLRVLGFSSIRVRVTNANQAGQVEAVESLTARARHLGMRQVAVDLHLSSAVAAPSATCLEDFVRRIGPDRLRLISANPGEPDVVGGLRERCVRQLAEMDYQHIGLDWFVRSSDVWWQARLCGRLHWSLLGFTEMPQPDVVGIGPGAVSAIGDFCGQNAMRCDDYLELLDKQAIPVVRGLALESDDALRREIMVMMLTAARIDINSIEDKWGVEFGQFFNEELGVLKRYEQAGWLTVAARSIVVHARGRRELTQLCRAFDRRSRVPTLGYTPSFA